MDILQSSQTVKAIQNDTLAILKKENINLMMELKKEQISAYYIPCPRATTV